MNNRAQKNPSIILPLPDLIWAIIVALQHLGIKIFPNEIDNDGKWIPFSIPKTIEL